MTIRGFTHDLVFLVPVCKDEPNPLLCPHRMSDPDPTIPTAEPSSGGAGSPPLTQSAMDLTDTEMHGALAPGTSGSAGTASRGWQPPTVEELQKMLPQYEVQLFLARGGMGAVYKGCQKSLDRVVAIKVLPPGIEDEDVHYGERFKQEARAMAKFKHPGIVAVHDAGETPSGLLYFIMEFIDGTDVAQLVAAQRKLPVAQALSITAQVCDALAYAHGRGIVHRDIKPSNIMIEADGTVKVADFGLAKVVAQESAALTRSDMSLGTPDFIAPESMIPGLKVDARADLYAVGVMLYQMLTGRIPRGRFRLPSGIVPEIDPGLDDIVDKAMQTDREQRYTSATEMKAAIEAVLRSTASTESAAQTSAAPVRNEELSVAVAEQPVIAGKSFRTLLAIAAGVVIVAGAALIFTRPGKPALSDVTKSPLSALEPGAIKLWDSEQAVPKEKAVRWENGAVVLGDNNDKGQLFYSEPRSRDAIIRAEIRANPDSEFAQLRLRYNWTQGNGDFYRLQLYQGMVSLSVSVLGKGKELQSWPLPRAYGPGEWARLELRAVGDELTVSLDGQALGTMHDTSLFQPGSIGIAANRNGYFRNVVYVPLDKSTKTVATGKVIDLLKLVDVKRDAILSEWSIAPEGGVRSKPSKAAGRLEFPYAPPAEYDFEIDFTVEEGNSGHVNQIIAVPGHWFMWTMLPPPAFGPDLDGIKLGTKGRTEGVGSLFRLKPGDRHRSVVEVRKDSVRALVDGHEIVRFTGDFKRLSDPWEFFKLRDTKHIGVGTFSDVGLLVHKATVREISGAGSPDKAAAIPPSGWTPVDLKDKGWIAEGAGFTTDQPIRGLNFLPDGTRDAAARITYTLRDATGLQITARGRMKDGKYEKYVVEEEKGTLQIGRMLSDGLVKPLQKLPYPPSITHDGEHTLEIRIEGDTLTATLNGKLTVITQDNTLPEGSWALVLKKGILVTKLEVQTPKTK